MKLKRSLVLGCCMVLICIVADVQFCAAQISAPAFQTVFLPGAATHIVVGPNGTLWALGTEQVHGGHNILFWANNQWNGVEGGAEKIVVDRNSEPWIVNSEGMVFRREANRWIELRGLPAVKEITLSPDGSIYALSMQGQVYQFLPTMPLYTSIPVQSDQYEKERIEGERREREERERREREQAQPVIVGCRNAAHMSDPDLRTAISTINALAFDDSKLTTANQIVGANCLTTDQIGQIMALFSFEDRKLTFAKFAYDHCTDPQNYYKLNSQFAFSSNSDALSNFVQSKQH